MDAAHVLLVLGESAPWTPLSRPSLRFHVDLSRRTLVSGGVDSWTDHGPTATHATTATLGAGNRPPLLADAGDGLEAVDFRSGGTGKVLVAPFSKADLAFLHDGVSPWTIGANVLLDPGETIEQVICATGALTAAHAGILWCAMVVSAGFRMRLYYCDGTSTVQMMQTVVSAPERAYYWLTFDPARSPKARLFRNGVEVDEWDDSVPALAGESQDYGLVLGQYAYTDRYHCSWRGRTLSIFDEALTDEQDVVGAANWAWSGGYL